MRKVGKISLVLILAGGLLAINVGAAVFDYFVHKDITVNSEKVFYWDGVASEMIDTSGEITINASETVQVDHTILYNGSRPDFNVTITETNGFVGITHNLYLDDVLLDGNYVVLNDEQLYNLTIEFVAAHNLSGGDQQTYGLTIAPSIVQN